METILFPIGRLVMGSLYKAQDKDRVTGKPFIDDSGKPYVKHYIALAIPKGSEQHWNQTEWGKKIYDVAVKGFPNGQANSPLFSWKIVDGDSNVPNGNGRKPCDSEGHKGHWIVNFSNRFASPILCDEKGALLLKPEEFIKPGDYIQVFGNMKDNGNQQKPGVYLNHTHVAFIGFGERITVSSIDPTTIGFGGALPAGASKTPISSGFNSVTQVLSAPYQPPVVQTLSHAPVPVPAAAPPAYPNILKPKIMTDLANGATYEAFIQQGWTDEALIQHGYLQA
jgi:hypothetical protein